METSKRHLYWGILHCHVGGSLCHNTKPFSTEELRRLDAQIDQLYDFARNDRKFDFLAYADHYNMGQMIAIGDADGSPWQLVRKKAEQYNDPGRFAALLGYEYQDGMEYNVYLHGTKDLPMGDDWPGLMATVEPGDPRVILAAHNRPSPTDWQFPRHDNFRLIEILNDGSVFEGWANLGLTHGHTAAFIGGSDDHGCHPGRNACTGVWADSLDAESVWEALRAGRTIAATGIRPALSFTVNGLPMGSFIPIDSRLTVSIGHHFDRPPLYVMLIADGHLLRQWQPAETEFEIDEIIENDTVAGESALYAKFLYADGNVAFCSPVFLTEYEPENRTPYDAARHSLTSHSASYSRRKNGDAANLGEISLKEEFGNHVGWHKYINASSLIPDRRRPVQKIRDMVIHTGADALLVRQNGNVIAPTMEGITGYDAERRPTRLHALCEADEPLLVTSLVEIKEGIIAAGYCKDVPHSFTVCGKLPDALQILMPIYPYFYRDRWVTPRYLSTDGHLLACLAERECTLATPGGEVLAFCQEGYPAMPSCVDFANLGCIVVLSCDGTVCCYDASASQSARLRWHTILPEAQSGVTIVNDEVWCYNRSFHGCYSRDPIEIFVLSEGDGRVKGVLRPDLINIRGTTIRPLAGNHFAALHNPELNGAAVYRNKLNQTGKVRIFQRNR